MTVVALDTAESWACEGCGVTVSWMDGHRGPLPDTWAHEEDGPHCLKCRRELAAEAALDAAPEESNREARAKMRRASLIEFEVRRTPERPNNTIARACHASRRSRSPPRVNASSRRPRPPAGVDGLGTHRVGPGAVGRPDGQPRLALKHRGCQRVAPVHIRRPLESVRGLARSRWFAAGWGLAAVAWLIHIAALSMAPISLVQTILAGGAVTLAVMSRGCSAIRGAPAVAGAAAGGRRAGAAGDHAPPLPREPLRLLPAAILGFEGGLAALAAGLALGHRSERLEASRGVMLAAISGTLFAVAGVAIKGLTGAGGRRSRSSSLGRPDPPQRRARPVHRGGRPAARRRDRDDRPDGPGRERCADLGRRARLRRSAQHQPVGHRPSGGRLRDGLLLGAPAARPRAALGEAQPVPAAA